MSLSQPKVVAPMQQDEESRAEIVDLEALSTLAPVSAYTTSTPQRQSSVSAPEMKFETNRPQQSAPQSVQPTQQGPAQYIQMPTKRASSYPTKKKMSPVVVAGVAGIAALALVYFVFVD